MASGVIGLLLAGVMLRVLRYRDMVQGLDVQIGIASVLFAFCIAVVTGCLIGLAAGSHVIGIRLEGALRSRQATAPLRVMRSQRRLLIAQIAFAAVLTFAAGALATHAGALARVDPGYDVDRLLHVPITLASGTTTHDQNRALP